MSDDEFLSSLFHKYRDPTYSKRDDAYVQARADEIISAEQWEASDRQQLVEILTNATDPEASLRGITVDGFRREALRCLDALASQVRNIPVGFLASGEINAFVVKNPCGGPVIILNLGLEANLQLILYSYLAIATYPFEHAFDRSHSIVDFAQSIVMVAHSLATGTPDGVVKMPTWDCHEKALQDETMLMFVLFVDVFVLLHEYGHAVCGHLENAMTFKVKMGDSHEEALFPGHAMEFEADEFALRHLRNFAPNLSFAQIVYPVGVFFRFLDLCEAIGGRQASETHPPSLLRWHRLKSYLTEDELNDPDVRNVDAIFNNIFTVIGMLSEASDPTPA